MAAPKIVLRLHRVPFANDVSFVFRSPKFSMHSTLAAGIQLYFAFRNVRIGVQCSRLRVAIWLLSVGNWMIAANRGVQLWTRRTECDHHFQQDYCISRPLPQQNYGFVAFMNYYELWISRCKQSFSFRFEWRGLPIFSHYGTRVCLSNTLQYDLFTIQ